MKIALYHPWIYLKSGLERTILEILKQTEHEIIVYTSHYDPDKTYPELQNYDIREINPVSVERNYGAVLGAGKKIASTKLEIDNCDVLVICCDGLGSFINIRNRDIPIINLCFTPLRAVYDEEYRKRHFKNHATKKYLAQVLELGYKIVDKWCWKQYAKTICISNTVKERVLAANLAKEEEIVVCYPGIDQNKITPSKSYEKYFFIAGRIMWTKNIELGIKAFQQFHDHIDSSFKLVIAGMVDKKSQSYFEELKNLAQSHPNIEFVIEPSDTEMESLYAHSYASLFTAFNEDLGLTPMEAMTKGKAVIAVNKGGPREVIRHHQTGYLVNADENSFALAMARLATMPELAKMFGEQGAKDVTKFTWQQFVFEFDSVISEHGN